MRKAEIKRSTTETEVNIFVNLDGKVWGMENILVCDASILPSCFGESPQETVMAFAHKIIKNHLFV